MREADRRFMLPLIIGAPGRNNSDRQGISAPVSFREARVFTTAQEALGVLEQERGIQNSPRR